MVMARLFLALLVVLQGLAVSVKVPVYRLLQYNLDGRRLGARRSDLNHAVKLVGSGQSFFRSLVVIPYRSIEHIDIHEVIASLRGLGGLLLLLPEQQTGAQSLATAQQLGALRTASEQLLAMEVPVPVYYTFDGPAMQEVVQHLGKQPAEQSLLAGSYHAMVKVQIGKPLQQPPLSNVWGFIPGPEGSSLSRLVGPTLAIVAHTDSFAAAPALATGGVDPGSSVAALLELSRVLGRVMAAAGHGKSTYNVLFLLTAAGRLGQAGLNTFLTQQENRRLFESIEFALCLDSIAPPTPAPASRPPLYLYYSRPAKTPEVAQWYDTLTTTADHFQLKIEQRHRKVNMQTPYPAFGHEFFALHKLFAATLSLKGHVASSQTLQHPGLDPPGTLPDVGYLEKVIRMIGVFLVDRAYDSRVDGLRLFGGGEAAPGAQSVDVTHDFLQSVVATMADETQQVPFVTSVAPQNPVLTVSERVLRESCPEVGGQPVVLGQTLQVAFFGGLEATLKMFYRQSPIVDVVVLVATAGYLVALYLGVRVHYRGLNDVLLLLGVGSVGGDKKM